MHHLRHSSFKYHTKGRFSLQLIAAVLHHFDALVALEVLQFLRRSCVNEEHCLVWLFHVFVLVGTQTFATPLLISVISLSGT